MAVNWTPQEVQRKTRQAVVTTITRICTNIEEHAVNAINGADRFEVIDRGYSFGLHQQAGLVIGIGQIARRTTVI